MIERETQIESAGARLAGTLCLPDGAGPFPVVLMIHGTGPLDRDENMPRQRLNVFNTIAQRLAEAGIASLRYDKRGCGHSSGDYYSAGHADLVADATDCFDALATQPACDPERIVVLGHSEGCIIAPQLAFARPAIAGLVLLCPFVDGVENLLMKQAARIQAEFEGKAGSGRVLRRIVARCLGLTVASQERLIQRLRSSGRATLRAGFAKVPARALRELLELNPPAIFAAVRCPLLLVGGAKDLQCDPADVPRIAEIVRGPASAHVVADLTHVLRRTAGPPSMLGSAGLLGKPLDAGVLELIENWLRERLTPAVARPAES